MANPYSKYTGARVQPLPSGFIEAYGRVGESYRKGIVGLAEGIQKYHQNKEERAILEGRLGAALKAHTDNPDLFPLDDKEKAELNTLGELSLNNLRKMAGKFEAAQALNWKAATHDLQKQELAQRVAEAKAKAAAAKAAGDKARAEQLEKEAGVAAFRTGAGVDQPWLPAYHSEDEGVVHFEEPLPSWAAPTTKIDGPDKGVSPAVESGDLEPWQAEALRRVPTAELGMEMQESWKKDSTTDTRSTAEKNLEAFRKTSRWESSTPQKREEYEARIFGVEDTAETATSRMKEIAAYDKAYDEAVEKKGEPLTEEENDKLLALHGLVDATSTAAASRKASAEKIAADAIHAENRNELHEITKRAAEAEATIKEADATPEAIAHRKGMRQLSMTAQVTQNMLAAQKVLTPEQILMRDTLAKHEMDLAKERLEAAEWANNPELRERAKVKHDMEVRLAEQRILQIQQDMNADFASKPVQLDLLKEQLEKAKADRAAMETPEERQVRLRNEIADLNLKLQRSVLNAQEIAENENVLEAIDAGTVETRDIPGAPGYKFVRTGQQGWQLINTDPQRGVRGVVRDVTEEEAKAMNAELEKNGFKAMWVKWPAAEKGKYTYKFQSPSGAALDALLRSNLFGRGGGGDQDALQKTIPMDQLTPEEQKLRPGTIYKDSNGNFYEKTPDGAKLVPPR